MSTIVDINTSKTRKQSSSRLYIRQRLFDHLDYLSRAPIVWMAATRGAGKTSFLKSYLENKNQPALWYRFDTRDQDPSFFFSNLLNSIESQYPDLTGQLPRFRKEHIVNLGLFARRFFELFFRNLSPGSILVLDNAENLPESAEIHQLLQLGLELIPHNYSLFVLSHRLPPVSCSHLVAKKTISLFPSKLLRFSDTEVIELARLFLAPKNINSKLLKGINHRLDGWAAGLIMYLEDKGIEDGSDSAQLLDLDLPEEMFNYLADIFLKFTDPRRQQFLLKTAWLPIIRPEHAIALTSDRRAERILEQLADSSFFTHRVQTPIFAFEYHSLFKEFLQRKCCDMLEKEELRQIKLTTASLLLDSNDIENAVALLIEAKEWDQVAETVLNHARDLIDLGHVRTVRSWIESLPDSLIKVTPWITYWHAKSLLYSDPIRARMLLVECYHRFLDSSIRTGYILSWAGIIETYYLSWHNVHELDKWLDAFDLNNMENSSYISLELEAKMTVAVFTALIMRRPDHPDFDLWSDKMMALLNSELSLNARTTVASLLLFHYIWYAGDRGKASIVIQSMPHDLSARTDLDPFAQSSWCSHAASYMCWFKGNKTEVYESVELALEKSRIHGIELGNSLTLIVGACAAFMAGDIDEGKRFIKRSLGALNPLRKSDLGLTHAYAAWAAWLDDNIPEACEHAKISLQTLEQVGAPSLYVRSYIGLSQIELSQQNHALALSYLNKAKKLSKQLRSTNNYYICLLISAKMALTRKQTERAAVLLKHGFAIGRRQGFINIPWFKSEDLVELCVLALERKIETGYVHHLIKTIKLTLRKPPVHLRQWPWPVRITTLENFSVEVQGKVIRNTGKAQKRPLDILKYLIAFGGRYIRGEQIMEAFWPDIEPEKSYGALHTNLHRLRKLIGIENAIHWDSGQVSLNPQVCWVDAWALENSIKKLSRSKIDFKAKNGSADYKTASVENPFYLNINLAVENLNLYCNPFLEGDDDHSWILGYREQLNNKFIRANVSLAQNLAYQGKRGAALELLWKGIDADPSTEIFYQELIKLYASLGKEYDVEMTFTLCKHNLSRLLDTEPGTDIVKSYRRALETLRLQSQD